MVTGAAMKDFDKTFGVTSAQITPPYAAILAHSSVPGQVLVPGEAPRFEIQLQNRTAAPLQTPGKIEVIAYGTRGIPGDIWKPETFRIGVVDSVPIAANMAANGFQNLSIAPRVPIRFGGYALVADLGKHGRQFITGFVRTFAPNPKRLQYPSQSLDELPLPVLKRLGVQAIRSGVSYKPTTDPDFEEWYAREGERLKRLQAANITVLFMAGAGDWNHPNQPLGRPRPWLNEAGELQDTKTDIAWMPAYDADFQKFCRRFASDYGWPRGPITAFSLWNEPWEGISISGWGADMLRYREIYRHMVRGVDQARRTAKVDVLTGGLDSSSNAFDKLFPDASSTKEFLPTFDFLSVHYQGLSSMRNVKMWRDRPGPRGRVRIWDTESWVANTDDRVAAVVATNRASGYDRAMGIYGGNIAGEARLPLRTPDGKSREAEVVHTWSTAAAVGATQHFLGERPFQRMLFSNGLPWVMMFGGEPQPNGQANAEDGTLVVVGDLGETFGAENLLFRTARGARELANEARLQQQISALPSSKSKERAALQTEIDRPETLAGATMTLRASGDDFSLFDPYGNRVAPQNGRILVPLDGRGFFLRGNGEPGSFAKLVRAVQGGYVQGIEPLATVARDFTLPIAQKPTLRLELTNVLNRSVRGQLSLQVGGLKLQGPRTLLFAPNETKKVSFQVVGGKARPDNAYPLSLVFDAGRDGRAVHRETMRVNVIARRTPKIDGQLNDWGGVLPQTVQSAGGGPSLTEAAWFPFKSFDARTQNGVATGFLAYDQRNFYFAVKAADATPDAGMVRFARRDDDAYFYPKTAYFNPSNTGATPFAARWSGEIQSGAAGLTTFFLESDDGSRLFVDDKLVINSWRDQGATETSGTMELEANRRYAIRIEYYQGQADAVVRFSWQPPGGPKELVPQSRLFPAAMNGGINPQVGNGLRGEYFRDRDFKDLVVARLDSQVNFDFGPRVPDPAFASGKPQPLRWPDGVRRYSYRRDPDLPFGNFPARDNVQIAFNVLAPDQKPWTTKLPGLPDKFTSYWDTDYEYALNPVAPQFGGGTEVWRALTPGMPRKHFYPRQPKAPGEGAVEGARLVVRRQGNTRLVEAAIPWSEIPHVKAALGSKRPIKFSFRVNDNGGGGTMELSRERSVAKRNPSFRVDWVEHWANEVEFGWER